LEPRAAKLTVRVHIDARGLLAIQRAPDGRVLNERQRVGVDLTRMKLDPRFLDAHGP